MGRACRNSARSAADRFNKIMKHTVCKVVTVSDGSTIEKETMLGGRALNYLYALADMYYKAAESSADTPPNTAAN